MVNRWAAAITACPQQQPRPLSRPMLVSLPSVKTHSSAGFRQSPYHLHRIPTIITGTFAKLPRGLFIQMFLSAWCFFFVLYFCILHLLHHSHCSDAFCRLCFYILNAAILWIVMTRGGFSPLWSPEPELLNYWWNTDVSSSSHNKCIPLKKKCGFNYLIPLSPFAVADVFVCFFYLSLTT